MKDLTISHAVRHTASNVASFKHHPYGAMTVPYRHEVSLNPDQIERDVWMVAQSFWPGGFKLKSTLRFFLESELVAEIPNSRGNATMTGEDLLIGIHAFRLDPTYYPFSTGPSGGRQPNLAIQLASNPSYSILIPSFFLRVRATRAVLDIERGTATEHSVSGLAVLSQYP